VSTKISILIPTYNEAARIQDTLRHCAEVAEAEIIVVDGGSTDGTRKLARESGVQVLVSSRGRGRQLNLAASQARGDILLFLHADTYLPPDFPAHVVSALKNPHAVGGAFRLKIRGDSISLRLIELGVNIRSQIFRRPYGDQAIFLKAEVFKQLNGFREIPIMEDLDLVRRLSKIGRIVVVAAYATTSARRWNQLGPFKTTLINQVAIVAYSLGIPPARIASFYHRKRFLP